MAAPALLARLYSQVLAAPANWLIAEEYLNLLQASDRLTAAGLTSYGSPEGPQELPDIERLGGTGVISICGTLMKNPDEQDLEAGACDVDRIALLVRIAAMDPTIERVVLHIQSPGGQAIGLIECAKEIATLNRIKPVYVFSDLAVLSAAYWLAVFARQIYLTPSARAGSIGGFFTLIDQSEALKAQGITINAFSVGKFKLAGASFKAMSDEERGYFQEKVERDVAKFKAAVVSNRDVAAESMEGQTFDAEQAIAANLADGIVNNFEELLRFITPSAA